MFIGRSIKWALTRDFVVAARPRALTLNCGLNIRSF